MRSSTLFALAASLSSASAVFQGFNYGSTNTDSSAKDQAQFEREFTAAQGLVGTSGFSSARLYTMIQAGTANSPISAIPAAISTKTTLLLGMWASGGQTGFSNEIAALQSAITSYGDSFTSLIAGISVGSEDLYRISPTGIAAKSLPGADPSVITSYIGQLRSALQSTTLKQVSIGHVDTWTAWVNGSNSAVIDACDFLGVDAYPYFQNSMANGIESGAGLFSDAFGATVAVAKNKPVWITETGWPVSGPTENLAVPSLDNAKRYWDEVGCANFGKVNTWWFTLQDSFPTTPSPSFGIVGTTLSTNPLYDLTCPKASASSSAASQSTSPAAPSSSASQSSAQASGTNPPASYGGGLTPSQGAGNGVASSALAVATSSTTAGSPAAGNGSGSPSGSGSSTGNSTGTGTSATGTPRSPTGSSTSTSPALSGAMSAGRGSVLGAVAALMAAVFFL